MAVDYTTLTGAKTTAGSIKYLVNYERLDPESILVEAQAYIFGSLRVKEMEVTAAITQTADTDIDETLPTDFCDVVSIQNYLGDRPMQHVTPRELTGLYRAHDTDAADGTVETGTQSVFAVYDGKVNFDVMADTTVTLLMHYLSSEGKITSGQTSSWLTTRYPQILLAAVRYFAFLHMENDGQADRWLKILDSAIVKANVEADLHRGVQPTVMVY
jgi:ribosomal protein S18